MAKRILWIVMLLMVLGLNGCVLMEALAASAAAQTENGRIRIQNNGFYHQVPMRFTIYKDSTQLALSPGYVRVINDGTHFDYFPSEDGIYVIYYWDESRTGTVSHGNETSQSSKSISFSKGQVIEVNIGY